jgi:hypothetical protein
LNHLFHGHHSHGCNDGCDEPSCGCETPGCDC